MSVTLEKTYPCNPLTTRGSSTKLSSNGDRIVYTNGRTVVIRDLNTPAFGITYSQHVQPATVARISPSGYYCASADGGGNVRVWDIAGTDQVLKNEKKAISGKINDLAWDADSQRIIAVGSGREKFGVAFNADSGNSVGEITGHSKVAVIMLNATSIRHKRPFRAVTAGDDNNIVFYTGVPFKYQSSISTHTRFVQDVQFSPSGDVFASVGSDMKAFLYNGETGETLAELAGAHQGSIMACAWNPDSTNLLTSSMDRTVKLWDVETRQAVTTWNLGSAIENQQVGNTWAGDNLVSLSLNGTLNVFDKRDGSKPTRTLYGPTRSISSITSPSKGTFLAGSNDGRVISFTTAEGAQPISGEAHKIQVVALAHSGDQVYSIGFDDCVRSINVTENKFSATSNPTNGQPKDIAISGSTVYVATVNGVQVLENGKEKYKLPVNNPVTAIAVHGKTVAAGSEDKSTTLYEWDGSGLKELGKLTSNRGMITAIAFSPNGSLVAAADSAGKIFVYDVAKKEAIISSWVFHSARVYSLAWTADGKHCASGSLDTHIYIYSVDSPNENASVKNAHANGVTGVAWVGEGLLASSGADGCVRTWKVTPPS
ncbi:WD40 repeat-like protein [Ceratobasidium sp. 423]|nr:WD40 repeat-like protein [Ceratobasidium sp. 423]